MQVAAAWVVITVIPVLREELRPNERGQMFKSPNPLQPKASGPEPVFSLSATLVITKAKEVKTWGYNQRSYRKEKTRDNSNKLFWIP